MNGSSKQPVLSWQVFISAVLLASTAGWGLLLLPWRYSTGPRCSAGISPTAAARPTTGRPVGATLEAMTPLGEEPP